MAAMVNGRRFGDENSSLLDEFERLSIEAHSEKLKRVMLARSLSEPKLQNLHNSRLIGVPPIPLVTQVMHEQEGTRHHHGGFHKVLKKLLKPILGRKRRASSSSSKQQEQDHHNKDFLSFKAFSTSLRF